MFVGYCQIRDENVVDFSLYILSLMFGSNIPFMCIDCFLALTLVRVGPFFMMILLCSYFKCLK